MSKENESKELENKLSKLVNTDSKIDHSKKCLVIGAGYCRTGTSTLKKALEILGYDPCFHMSEVLFGDKKILPIFKKKFGDKDDGSFKEILELFDKYNSTTDHPMCLFWEELLQEFPNSKVILTIRSDESWYNSFTTTILGSDYFGRLLISIFFPHLGRVMKMGRNMYSKNFQSDFSKENLIKVFNQHNKNVFNFLYIMNY